MKLGEWDSTNPDYRYRFDPIPLDENTRNDLRDDLKRDDVVGICDEAVGGFYLYVLAAHEQRIVHFLNAAQDLVVAREEGGDVLALVDLLVDKVRKLGTPDSEGGFEGVAA